MHEDFVGPSYVVVVVRFVASLPCPRLTTIIYKHKERIHILSMESSMTQGHHIK